jgi:hypothetical protein
MQSAYADNTGMPTEQSSIEELSEYLDKSSRSITLIHTAVWTVGGMAFGAALGGDTRGVQLMGAAGYSLIAGLLGLTVGKLRAASFRLQALRARGK